MKKKSIESSFKSSINRSNIKEQILKVLNESEKPLSTEEISRIIKMSWHTVIRYCLNLEMENKVTKFEIGRVSAWQIKK